MKFTLALFAAASAEVNTILSKPDVPNSFEDQRDTLREHVNHTLETWYSDCPSIARWTAKLNDMVDKLDKAYNKCGVPYTEWTRKRRQADESEAAPESEVEGRLSKKDKAKATAQIRTVVKRIKSRNLEGCTRNRMLARAERIVGQMVEEDGTGQCVPSA
ncbi:unnamed protein product [Oikopleura dioica]|uniref:Uncharacterized protein n=1 Tax=Oikopleura dioica TaxID=34765 RepID=E4XKJ9_OIKDI|nr:unnamed protein product [Oikopleura dioica]CBY40918.1 unnamed protein product [Oikopleura dioica]